MRGICPHIVAFLVHRCGAEIPSRPTLGQSPKSQQSSSSDLARSWPQPPASVQIHRRSGTPGSATGVVVYLMPYRL